MGKIFLIMIGLSVGLMADFVRDAGTQIVTDNATGLQWQDDVIPETMTWQGAIDYCENTITLGGEINWRMPNINELASLVNFNTEDPAISSTFINAISGSYWSSTTYTSNTSFVWYVSFGIGYQYYGDRTDNLYVRCVRAGE